jgi:alkanesulfonate monooxygenase SsuD/methylene tetrahydromethanopterin reductase-like flavin-dependent oxidoreductase (luciferase family)
MGIHLGATGWTGRDGWRADAVAAQAASLEGMGYASYWLPENHFGDARSLPAPLLVLAAAAVATNHIQLATTSYLLPVRDPVLAAEEIAVIDQLCDGRLLLALGRGIQNNLFDVMGVDRRDKRTLFARNYARLVEALRGEALDEAGSTLGPRPLQQPHPPLWVAAMGPLALRQVGGLGLPYLASPLESLSVLAENYRLHREAADAAGMGSIDTVPVMRTVAVARNAADEQGLRDALAKSVPAQMTDKTGAVDDWAIVGDALRVEEKLAEYVGRLGMTHLVARVQVSGIDETRRQYTLERLPALCDKL